jgi:hypothetical protein
VASSTGLIIRAKRVEFRTSLWNNGTGVIASAALPKAVASGTPLCLCASWEERSMTEAGYEISRDAPVHIVSFPGTP